MVKSSYTKDTLKKTSAKDLSNDAYAMFLCFLFLIFFLNMNLTIPNLVPHRPFCYLNFISAAKPQKFGNETYDAHVLASSKTYRKQNKPKKWIPNPRRYVSF